MPTLKDLMAYVDDKGYVTIESIQAYFDLTEDQACRALRACWERGLLSPMTTSFFARPVDGAAPKLRGGRSRSTWHEPNMKKIRDLLDDRGGVGVAATDVAQALDVSRGTAVNVLRLMVDREELIEKQSEFGGSFGKNPMVWGRTPEEIAAREQVFKDRVKEVRSKRREKGQAPLTRSFPTTEERHRVRGPSE